MRDDDVVVTAQGDRLLRRGVVVGERDVRAVGGGEARCDPGQEELAGAGEGDDAHDPVDALGIPLDRVAGQGHRLLDLDGGRGQGPPGVGEHEPSALVRDQGTAGAALERLQVLGDGGGGDVEGLRGGADAATLGQLTQHPQLVQFHKPH